MRLLRPILASAAALCIVGLAVWQLAPPWRARRDNSDQPTTHAVRLGPNLSSMNLGQLLDEVATPLELSIEGTIHLPAQPQEIDPRRLEVQLAERRVATLGDIHDRTMALLEARRCALAEALAQHARVDVVSAIVARARRADPDEQNLLRFTQRLPPSWISEVVGELSSDEHPSDTWKVLSYLSSLEGVVIKEATLRRLVEMATSENMMVVARAARNCNASGARTGEMRLLLERLGSTMSNEERAYVEESGR